MYSWIWRHLPGNVPVKALLSLLLAIGAVYLLFQYVFPWAEPLLPFGEVTVEDGGSSAEPPSGSPSSTIPAATGGSIPAAFGAAAPSAVAGTFSLHITTPGAAHA